MSLGKNAILGIALGTSTAAGYVTPELTYPSYRALWRALRSRPESSTP